MPGFVGFNLEPWVVYRCRAPKSFRVSGVAIERGEKAKVYFVGEEDRYIIATLTKQMPQALLDLKFAKKEPIAFEVEGDATICLSGYIEEANNQEIYAEIGDVALEDTEDEEVEESEDDDDESDPTEDDDNSDEWHCNNCSAIAKKK